MKARPAKKPENKISRLAVDIAGVRLKNPVLTASGTFGYGTEYGQSPRIDLHSEILHTTCRINCYH